MFINYRNICKIELLNSINKESSILTNLNISSLWIMQKRRKLSWHDFKFNFLNSKNFRLWLIKLFCLHCNIIGESFKLFISLQTIITRNVICFAFYFHYLYLSYFSFLETFIVLFVFQQNSNVQFQTQCGRAQIYKFLHCCLTVDLWWRWKQLLLKKYNI